MSQMLRWGLGLVPLMALAACSSNDRLTGSTERARIDRGSAPALPRISPALVADPDEYTLYAGQHIPVGVVEVWNDATELHVAIDLADGWCMTESHVDARSTVADIPQTKKNNPIPGQFAAGDAYDPCADTDEFTFGLAGLDATPAIAVHVKVWEMTASTLEIVSGAGDPISTKNAWLDPWPDPPTNAVVSGYVGWPAIAGADYIATQTPGDPFNENWWRKVTETFDVPGLPVGGDLWVNSDNYEFTTLNGTEIQRDDDGAFDDDVNLATVEGSGAEPYPTGAPQTWSTIEQVSFMPVAGANTFEFVFRNVTWAGCCNFVDNPTGLAYRAVVTYYAHNESAWAAEDGLGNHPFDGDNWATYIDYAVTAFYTGDLWMGDEAFPGTVPDQHLTFSVYVTGGTYSYVNVDNIPQVDYSGAPSCVDFDPGTPGTLRFSYQIPAGEGGLTGLWIVWKVTGGATPTAGFAVPANEAAATAACQNGFAPTNSYPVYQFTLNF